MISRHKTAFDVIPTRGVVVADRARSAAALRRSKNAEGYPAAQFDAGNLPHVRPTVRTWAFFAFAFALDVILRHGFCVPVLPPGGRLCPEGRTTISKVKRSRLRLLPFFLLCLFFVSCSSNRSNAIVIGSKNFTEQAILGELLAQQIESHTQLKVERVFYLSGTYICQQAILAGRIDAYVEYTGTALTAILKDPIETNSNSVFQKVHDEYAQRFHLEVFPSLGFNNTFAIVVRGDDARRLQLHTISDAAPVTPQWRPGFGYEFSERPDGYPGLARTYNLKFATPPRVMDLGLLYRALLDNQVDLVAGNSTDGLLAARDLTILADDKHYFPPYDAVPIIRPEILVRHPEVRAALQSLSGKISDADMQSLNYAVDGQHQDVATVVHNFLRSKSLN
jgi:osmoprotectant transport system substrate-binding protein